MKKFGFLSSVFNRSKRKINAVGGPPVEVSSNQTGMIQVGDRIGGRYEVRRILGGEGRSGMGVVYVCLELEYRYVFALKTFQDKYLASREMKDSFRREALAWVHLERHPYIVRAVTVEELDYRLFILLEYIAPDTMGRNTLTHYLKSSISVQQASEWGIQFCLGMEHAASRGVTPHRDIKPDNIMITSDGIVKITDFGLAGLWDGVEVIADWREFAGEGHRGLSFLRAADGKVVAGTPPWMAPEEFEGEADVRSDIYSFGIVLYQMASGGKLPFHGMTGREYYQLHRDAPVPELDSKLFSVIKRCLHKNPERRYADFQELRIELENLYREETGVSPPSPPGEVELEAWEHSNKGLSFENLGLRDEAISEYRVALSIDPDDAIVRNNLGNALRDKGQLDEAIPELRAALSIDPDNAIFHNNLGNALRDKGQLNEAILEFRAALEINPDDARTYNNLGLALSDKSQLDEAISEYRSALKINTDYAHAHTNLGNALRDKGQVDEAILEFRAVLRITPDDADAHNNLGVAFADKGQLDEAISGYREALRINPDHAKAHYNLGNALKAIGRLNAAISEYRAVLRINPDHADAHNNLGNVLRDKGQIDEAISEFGAALRIAPDDAKVHNNLGNALRDKGQVNKAISEYRAALNINPDFANAHSNLGVAFADKGQLDEAILEFREALRINPDYAKAHYNLGVALAAKGQLDEAISEFREALRITPDYAGAHYNLGDAFVDKGQLDEAIEAYRNFIRFAPPEYASHVEQARQRIREIESRRQNP